MTTLQQIALWNARNEKLASVQRIAVKGRQMTLSYAVQSVHQLAQAASSATSFWSTAVEYMSCVSLSMHPRSSLRFI